MSELVYRLYGLMHQTVKSFLGKQVFPHGEGLYHHLDYGSSKVEAPKLWRRFIDSSRITSPEFQDLHYAGYIAERQEWCLPSWIWTNAAIVKLFCSLREFDKAQSLCDKLVRLQHSSGGWIVRNDYDEKGAIPILAPNDSAYLANNAVLSIYEINKDERYLDIAKKCATWIMETVRPDGLVYTGYNMRDEKWEKDVIIVDTGFAAGLFARLFELTGEEKYSDFLRRFVNRYVDLFFIEGKDGFCTSIDKDNNQYGGMFARGQAWALEGLIPAYRVLQSVQLRTIIDRTILNLIRRQKRDGSWAYNLTRTLMGKDCKAVSVIAKGMMDWYMITKNPILLESAKRALDWCIKHTVIEGEAKGGIISYSVEGGIVKHLYTSCAFVYANAYALELNGILSLL